MASPTQPSGHAAPIAAGIACYTVWGFMALVFQQMGAVGAGPWEIMAHRALWGIPWALLLVLLAGRGRQIADVLRNPRVLAWLALSAALIATNWSGYIIAVNSGRVLEAALGYYLNPLLNMAAGAWLFRERITRGVLIAIVLAGIGVLLQGIAIGHTPWIALMLAFTFCGYGIIRKRVPVDAQTGLLIECLILFVPGMIVLTWLHSNGGGHFFANGLAMFWLAAAGPITVIPLALFAWAARRMPLSSMGFIQFIAPMIGFGLGLAQGEPFGWMRALSFAFIWAGVIVFVANAVLHARRTAAESVAEPI